MGSNQQRCFVKCVSVLELCTKLTHVAIMVLVEEILPLAEKNLKKINSKLGYIYSLFGSVLPVWAVVCLQDFVSGLFVKSSPLIKN